jgi:hypothetical protein
VWIKPRGGPDPAREIHSDRLRIKMSKTLVGFRSI